MSTHSNEGYSALWPVINVFFFFPQFSQGINNPAQLKIASYKKFLFSSSSARTWRCRCFSLWKRRCRAPQAPTAGEPVTCLSRSWSRASCLPNETQRRDDGRRIPETTTRLRSPGNCLLLLMRGAPVEQVRRLGIFFFCLRVSLTSMGNALKPLWPRRDFGVQGCHRLSFSWFRQSDVLSDVLQSSCSHFIHFFTGKKKDNYITKLVLFRVFY